MDDLMLSKLTDVNEQVQHGVALQYFEQLKSSESGWKDCLQTIVQGRYANVSQVQFICLQVLEHHVKTRYSLTLPMDQQLVRDFLREWVKLQLLGDGRMQEPFILNKAAQIAALVFIQDYPSRWPEFFTEHIALAESSPQLLGHYLRVLLAIDGEVADKEIPRTAQELQRNAFIKDAMREKAVVQLVESWYKILTGLNGHQYPMIVRMCLQVVGRYVQWIDINLVANDRFVPVFVSSLCNLQIREAAADCIEEVVSKGMEPGEKMRLVESFSRVLTEAGAWVRFSDDADMDYLCRLGKLYSTMGTSLIEAHNKWSKIYKVKDGQGMILMAIENKIPILLEVLQHVCDDVSATVIDFAKEYLHLTKSLGEVQPEMQMSVRKICDVVLDKLRYDPFYDFEHEGEEEAFFLEYRKQLKTLFDNITHLDKDYMLLKMRERIKQTTQFWRQLTFDEVEVSLLIFYYLGECVPIHFTTPEEDAETPPEPRLDYIQTTMTEIINSGMYQHPHWAVTLQYFETISRYEKFFVARPSFIMKALTAFLKEHGLFHPNKKVRSRCCYLFSRFIKCIKCAISPELMQSIIDAIQPLLALSLLPKEGADDCLITRDDQLYLYEVIGVLIVSGQSDNAKKTQHMTDIVNVVLYPCRMGAEKLKTGVEDPEIQEATVELLVQAVALTGRLSKAFSNQNTMKRLNCVQLFLDALTLFLQLLDLPVADPLVGQLQSAVRQYLHRLVVCLEEELLPYIPLASQGLLKNCDCRSIQEYIPLINQVITKFKKDVVPFLKQMFTPMVQGVFQALQVPIEPNDQQAHRERQLLRRQYFHFIAALVTNNVTDVLAAQEPAVLQEVMMTVIQGSVDFPDPVAQKACFSILKKLVELWAGPEGPDGFMDFMYKNIVPACFVAPLKVSFDLNDAQTVLALNEITSCIKSIFDKRKEEFVAYLVGYLPTLNTPMDKTQQFVRIMQNEPKNFRAFVKQFFTFLKTVNPVPS